MVYTGHNRGRRGHSMDDNIGNRKGAHDVDRNLPEDIGNRRSAEDDTSDLPEDLGNRIGGPAPWSRQFLRGKGKQRGKGTRTGVAYKDMEQLYAAQGEGVPRFLRPGYRALPSGELAQVSTEGQLVPMGVIATTGERVNGSSNHHHQDSDEPGMDGEGRRKRRRRRKRGRGDGPEAPQSAQGGASGGGGGGHHAASSGFDEEDEGFRYQLKSDPEVKRAAAQEAVEQVLRNAGRQGTVKATVYQETHGPRVVVEIKEQAADGALFGRASAALGALTFLVNKIVNRYPDDRIRLSIVEEGTWVPQPAAPAAEGAAALPEAAAPPAQAAAADDGAEDGQELDAEEDADDADDVEDGDEEETQAAARPAGTAAPRKAKAAVKTTTRRTAAARKTPARKKAATRRTK